MSVLRGWPPTGAAVRSAQIVLEPSAAAIATTSSAPAVEEASSERTAVVTILFPTHLFPYAVKM